MRAMKACRLSASGMGSRLLLIEAQLLHQGLQVESKFIGVGLGDVPKDRNERRAIPDLLGQVADRRRPLLGRRRWRLCDDHPLAVVPVGGPQLREIALLE